MKCLKDWLQEWMEQTAQGPALAGQELAAKESKSWVRCCLLNDEELAEIVKRLDRTSGDTRESHKRTSVVGAVHKFLQSNRPQY